MNRVSTVVYGVLFICVCVLFPASHAQDECEVCVHVLKNFKENMRTKEDERKASGKKPKLSNEAAGDLLEAFCGKKMNRKDTKVCYNLLPMKNEVVRQSALGKDELKICQSLSKKNPDFCSIRYPVKTDQSTDYSKLRIKQLKNILSDRGVDCSGCLEKSDYVKRCKETDHMEL